MSLKESCRTRHIGTLIAKQTAMQQIFIVVIEYPVCHVRNPVPYPAPTTPPCP